MKELDPEALAGFDGGEGRPAYVAHRGRVYDVSASRLWKGGLHMRRHRAGRDLTADIEAAPHGPEMLERCPLVGQLAADAAETPPRRSLEALVQAVPFLRRHPHPMTVHFPIVYSLSAAGFLALSGLTGRAGFEETAYYCLWAGALFTPVAVGTGYATWRLNYDGRPLRPVTAKKRLAWLLWAATLGAALWRASSPETAAGAAYAALVFALVPVAAALGWLGALLTFPLEKKQLG